MTIPDLAGREIHSIKVSNAISIHIKGRWTVIFEGPTHLVTAEGVRPVPMDSYEWYTPDYLEFAADRVITSIVVSDNGDLAVNFEGGQLAVTNDGPEPWSIYGPRGEIIWGGPVGEWVVF